MAKITMNPAEIRAFSEKVERALLAQLEDDHTDAFGGVSFPTMDSLVEEVKDAVGIACDLDQVAGEYDLLTAAHHALDGAEGDLPPAAL